MELQRLRIRKPDDFVPVSEGILETTIIPPFERIVERHPDHDAIRSATQNLTYRQLNNAVNQLARQIHEASGADRSPIAILLDQEIPVIVALLGAAKTGRPYITLYPGHPDEALRSFIQDSTAGLLVTSTALSASAQKMLPKDHPPRLMLLDELQTRSRLPNPEYKQGRNDPIAIYYTSGSTGQPKGVLDGHLTKSFNAYCHVNGLLMAPSDRVSMVFSAWHAAGLSAITGTFIAGATLCLFDVARNGAQAALDWLEREEISIFWSMTSTMRAVFGAAPRGKIFPKLRLVRVGGEPTTGEDFELFKAHTAPDCGLNLNYASSEAGMPCEYTVYHDTPAIEGFVPGGYPLPNCEVLILDEEDRILTAGEEGEVCVSSPYLSLGYWNNPELTARVFRPHPRDPSRRICHTGDLGRLRQDGALEVYGRKDTQVKLRGFRIQLEMVDRALRSLEGVWDAATIVDDSSARGPRLVSYVAMENGHSFSVSSIRRQLYSQLPNYAIPAVLMPVADLPRTSSGKLSRTELPAPSSRRPDLEQPHIAATTPAERQVTGIWEQLLGLQGIGVQDNFFELGGDSLSAMEMTLQVENAFGAAVPQAFFREPTIRSLAELMANAKTDAVGGRDFVLASHREQRTAQSTSRLRMRLKPLKRFGKLIAGVTSPKGRERLLDFLVARHIVRLPYDRAVEWTIRWSNNPLVLRLLYAGRADLFARWMRELGVDSRSPLELFPLNVVNNMTWGLSRYLGKLRQDTSMELQRMTSSPYAFWRTLGQLLDSTPPGQCPDRFQIGGGDHLMAAYARGKGVVLVSYHGMTNPAYLFPVERMLKLDRTPTISFRTPRAQSKYRDREHEIAADVSDALNAEIALFGQRRLQEGKVIQVVSDGRDVTGRTYRLEIARRAYLIKSGFAELALNTGAAIIPHWRYCLPDGTIRYEFGAPLDGGAGDRMQQIDMLLNQYAAFMERTWVAHPEAMRWGRIKEHLKKRNSMR